MRIFRPTFFFGALLVILVGAGTAYFLFREGEASTPLPVLETPALSEGRIIGTSVEGRAIEAYTFGTGNTHLLFVGGIHGGYEPMSVLLAYEFIDYFEANPEVIPTGVRVSIVPSANPDGVFRIIGKEGRFSAADAAAHPVREIGRFNANGVDLNRNFDCKWQSESMWKGSVVSAGTMPFSEPEASAVRDFVLTERPDAAVFWHSQANAVYASECENGILPLTRTLMNAYAGAAGYQAVDVFDSYSITGDAEGWLASVGIPAITVELSTHESLDWEKNLLGVTALIGEAGVTQNQI